jgi:hypothetical protein
MTKIEMIAQAVGIVAMAFNILSFQRKTRAGAISFQLVGGLLFSVNFFMLGAVVGGILNAVAFARAIIFLNKEKLHADNLYWLTGFIIVDFIPYILTFAVFGKELTPLNIVLELLPVIGMIASTISFRYSDAKSIRKYGLISSPSWLIYNIASGSIGAVICEVLSLGSIVIGILRHDRNKK